MKPRMTSLADIEPSELIRTSRRVAGLTQAALAERVGTTQSAVSRWERGHEEPRLARLAAVLAACGVRASLTLTQDDGVDRAQIRQQLAMSPAERLASVTNISRFVATAKRV